MPAEAIRINRRVLLQCSIGAPGLKQPFAQPQQNGALSALRTVVSPSVKVCYAALNGQNSPVFVTGGIHRFWRIGCDMGFLSGEERSSRPLKQDRCLRLPDGSLFELQYVAFRVACINDEKRLLTSSKIRDLAL